MKKRQIAILGSTGSIGTQALQVIEEHSELYEVYCLTANNKIEVLAQQAHQFKPAAIVIANEARYDELKRLMDDLPDVKVYAGKRLGHLGWRLSHVAPHPAAHRLLHEPDQPELPYAQR